MLVRGDTYAQLTGVFLHPASTSVPYAQNHLLWDDVAAMVMTDACTCGLLLLDRLRGKRYLKSYFLVESSFARYRRARPTNGSDRGSLRSNSLTLFALHYTQVKVTLGQPQVHRYNFSKRDNRARCFVCQARHRFYALRILRAVPACASLTATTAAAWVVFSSSA